MANIDFKEYAPPEDLRPFVDSFWSSHIDQDGILRLLPTACSVFMTCRTPSGEGLLFVGPMSKAHVTNVLQGEDRVGVWLAPGTKLVLSDVNFPDMKDAKLYAAGMQHEAVTLFEQTLRRMHTTLAKLEGLETLLRSLVASGALQRDAAVDDFMQKVGSSEDVNFKDIILASDLGERQFRRRFKEFVGLTPKTYMRILRQRQAIQMLTQTSNIAHLAAGQGYADHAHFSHEFRQYIGTAPIEFEQELTIKL